MNDGDGRAAARPRRALWRQRDGAPIFSTDDLFPATSLRRSEDTRASGTDHVRPDLCQICGGCSAHGIHPAADPFSRKRPLRAAKEKRTRALSFYDGKAPEAEAPHTFRKGRGPARPFRRGARRAGTESPIILPGCGHGFCPVGKRRRGAGAELTGSGYILLQTESRQDTSPTRLFQFIKDTGSISIHCQPGLCRRGQSIQRHRLRCGYASS